MPLRQRRLGYWLATAGLAFIFVLTLSPYPEAAARAASTPLTCIVCGDRGGVDVLLNILLFLPLGFGLALADFSWRRVLILALLLSFSIELLQMKAIAGRDASLGDVLTNTFGGGSRRVPGWPLAGPRTPAAGQGPAARPGRRTTPDVGLGRNRLGRGADLAHRVALVWPVGTESRAPEAVSGDAAHDHCRRRAASSWPAHRPGSARGRGGGQSLDGISGGAGWSPGEARPGRLDLRRAPARGAPSGTRTAGSRISVPDAREHPETAESEDQPPRWDGWPGRRHRGRRRCPASRHHRTAIRRSRPGAQPPTPAQRELGLEPDHPLGGGPRRRSPLADRDLDRRVLSPSWPTGACWPAAPRSSFLR